MKPIPILFLGDNPMLSTGLARIGRDLACKVSTMPQFKVGYLGKGGTGNAQLPFPIYPFPAYAGHNGEDEIEYAWNNLAGDERGIIFTILDPSRLYWFANPVGIEDNLGNFLRSGRFDRWGYFPVDCNGVGDRLTVQSIDAIRHYQRVLAYGVYGAGVLGRSLGASVDWIPHGLNLDRFVPRDRSTSRQKMGVNDFDLVIGCVMTNQARKDWGLAFATVARLRIKYPNLKFWAHIDVMNRHWDLRALAADFALDVICTTSGQFSDYELSEWYSGCNLTILPSLGEGFGYPIAESLACGVPVIHGNCGGGAELIPDPSWRVEPVAERLDTPYDCVRPVFSPVDWVGAVEKVLASPPSIEFCRDSVLHLDWKSLWPARWRKWMLEGVDVKTAD